MHRRLHHVARLSQLVSRSKRKTEEIDFLFIVAPVVVPHAVTLPADLRRPRWKEVPWFHDRRIVISADMANIAAQRVPIDPNVLAGRPVTRFARDSKLRGRRVGGPRLAQIRRNGVAEQPFAMGGVTVDTDAVPASRFGEYAVRWRTHERGRAWNPALI